MILGKMLKDLLHREDVHLLVQRRPQNSSQGWEHLAHEYRLRDLRGQPGEEKALGRSHCSLPVPEGGL